MDIAKNKKEARKLARAQWANATDKEKKDGISDCEGPHCMPFCGKYIAAYYPVCVPNTDAFTLPGRDRQFPHGRLYPTTADKDAWVESSALAMIERRIAIETNKTARKLGVDEFGEVSEERTAVRFNKNNACQQAYERYFCWLNFPRCDSDGESLPLCQSVCGE